MFFTILKPRITARQKATALAVAGLADLLQIVLWPLFGEGAFSPLEDLLDVLVAAVLMTICGFRWQFVAAFLLEALPGFDLFPTWTALVLSLAVLPADAQGFSVLSGRATRPQRQGTPHPPIAVSAVVVPPVQGPSEGAGAKSRSDRVL